MHICRAACAPTSAPALPLQRAMAIFTNMDEFHVSWDYSDATEGLAKTAILVCDRVIQYGGCSQHRGHRGSAG